MLFASCVDHVLLLIVCVQTSGWTAIFFVIEKNNLELIEMLIKGGARLDIKDNVKHLSLSLFHFLFYSTHTEWSDSI